MGYSCTLIAHSDNALSGVLVYAKDKFEALLKPHHGGYFYVNYGVTPAQLAEMVRATVSDPEPEPVKKVKRTLQQLRDEDQIIHEGVYENVIRQYPDAVGQEFNKRMQAERKKVRDMKKAEQAEIDASKPVRKIAIDCTSPENAMLLHTLESCVWNSFYAPSTKPSIIDDELRTMLGLPADSEKWAYSWADNIGFILSMGKHELGGTKEQRDALAKTIDGFEWLKEKPLAKILQFLQDRYVSSGSYTYHK